MAFALALTAAPARAATLAFTGTLTLQLTTRFFAVPANRLVISASGAAQTTDDGGLHLVSVSLAGGTFGPTTTSVRLPPLTHPSTGAFRWTGIQNQAASFANLSGGPPGGGTMGVQGLAKICLIFDSITCSTIFVPIPFSSTAGAGFGIGGTQVFTGFVVDVTQRHAPWTLGQPVITIHYPSSNVTTPMLPGGFAHGPASGTSSTAQPSGALQLVTVTRQFTSLTGAWPEMELIGVLTLHFVPEPGTLVLLLSGGVVLALAGRRRRGS